MTALSEKIAREHQKVSIEGCICGWSDLGLSHVRHVAEVAEAATREQVAREIADYCDAALELIDSNNGARLAFEMILTIARGGGS